MKLQFAEISRRGVFRTLAAYIVASWVLIEVVSVIGPAFLLPGWTVAAIATLVVLGAIPILLFSWRYQVTRDGIRRDDVEVSDETDRLAKRISFALLILLLAVIATLWANYFRTHSQNELGVAVTSQQGAPEIGEDGVIRSLAVLPFENFSPDQGRGLLADGIPEAILHVLAQNKELLVTARTSSFAFRDRNLTASEIGRILNVQALLEGSVQISGDQLRVTSQLVRTSDQAHIWSNVYESKLEDIFKIQDAIASSVRDLVFEKSVSRSVSAADLRYPDLEAYELLLEAKSLLGEEALDDAEHSASLLRLAIDISPEYADAYAWLTVALTEQTRIRMDQRGENWGDVRDLWTEVESATEKALQLDPNNAIAILQRGQLSQGTGGEGYEKARVRALEVAPNDPDVLLWIAGLDQQQLDFERARTHIRRARLVDPGNFSVLDLYISHFCGREELLSMVDAQLMSYPASTTRALRLRAASSLCDGRFVDSLTTKVRLLRLDEEPGTAVSILLFLANMGNPQAKALVNRAHQLVPGMFVYGEGLDMEKDASVYDDDMSKTRLRTYLWHANNGANPYFFMIPLSLLQIQEGDLEGAESSLAFGRRLWRDYYAFRGGNLKSVETLTIGALQAWLMRQSGDSKGYASLAEDLQQTLKQARLYSWDQTRHSLADIPVLIMLLNGDEESALAWLRAAERDRWIGFQALLTSPIYKDFRTRPEVSDILSRMAEWRASVLSELDAAGLDEVSKPTLLIEKIESLVPQSELRRGQLALEIDHDYQKAADHYRRALAQQGIESDVLADALHLAYVLGQYEEAIALAEHAVGIYPNEYFAYYRLGFSYFWARQWGPSIDAFGKAIEQAPDSTYLYRWIGIAKLMRGDAEAALIDIDKVESDVNRLLGQSMAYHALGRAGESDAALAELVENHSVRYAFNIAYVLAYRGEIDRSFKWLQQAVENNNAGLSTISYQPLFAPLHDDPRWAALLRSLHLAPEQLADVDYSLQIPN